MKRIIILLNIFVLTLFMTSCGNKTKNDENYDSLGASEIVDESPHNYTLSEYLKSGKTLILYATVPAMDTVGKDSSPSLIFIFKDNLLSVYSAKSNSDEYISFGDISRMSDDDIINMCTQSYESFATDIEYVFHLYTDDTGNNVEKEKIFFVNEIDYTDEFSSSYMKSIMIENPATNKKAKVYDSEFIELSIDIDNDDNPFNGGTFMFWYRSDGYTINLDGLDSEDIMID